MATPSGVIKTERREEPLREQIVEAALQLFRRKGYQSTSIADITEAANCSTGGFYHHFSSKDDLLYLVHDTFISYELEKGRMAVELPGSASSRLRQVIIDLVESIELFQPHVTVFFEERRFLSYSDKFSQIKAKRDEYHAIVNKLVEEGIRRGEFRLNLHPRIVTFGIFGMCNWTYQWFRSGGELTSREVGEMLAGIIVQGIQVDAEDAADNGEGGQSQPGVGVPR